VIEAADAAGFCKLVSRVFPENAASRALLRRMDFREVGVCRRHGQLDGVWRDCVIVGRLLDSDRPATAGAGRSTSSAAAPGEHRSRQGFRLAAAVR
jgi:hypothetical protein